jgi:hypothetical protein
VDLYWITDRLIALRVGAAEEAIGLAISLHDEFLELDPLQQFGGLARAGDPETKP